jgi:3-hydroxy-9,10-secoandrosta-1,3,5(10)-triene-9,17-dione monooxygenase reductase component
VLERPGAFSTREFRDVMSRYVTGVTVVTGWDDGMPVGMTANSFTSVSAEPPMVAFCPAVSSETWPKIAPSGRFLVNVLSQGQDALARTFAARGTDRFAGVHWSPAGSGPALKDAVVVLHCEIAQLVPAGDHLIVVAVVSAIGPLTSGAPLVFFGGGFARLHDAAVGASPAVPAASGS